MASNVFSMLDDDDTTHEMSAGSAAVGALPAAPDALPLSAPVMTPPRHGTSDDTRKREGTLEAKAGRSSAAADSQMDTDTFFLPSLPPRHAVLTFFVLATLHTHRQ